MATRKAKKTPAKKTVVKKQLHGKKHPLKRPQNKCILAEHAARPPQSVSICAGPARLLRRFTPANTAGFQRMIHATFANRSLCS